MWGVILKDFLQDPKIRGVISDIHILSDSTKDISVTLGKMLKEMEKSNRLKEKELDIREQELELGYEDLMERDLRTSDEEKTIVEDNI